MARVSPDLAVGPPTALAMFDAALARDRSRPFLKYFDADLSFDAVDKLSDALAKSLTDNDFRSGDRLALYLQNNPAFVVGLLAAWKAGGIAVPVNPMNTARELTFALVETGARALLCLDTLHRDVAGPVVDSGETEVEVVYVASARDFQSRDDPRVLTDAVHLDAPADVLRLTDLASGAPVARAEPVPDDPAVLTYTSGTTGIPRACVNTHSNLVASAEIYRTWFGLDAGDVVLGVTPMFHITGLIGHLALALHLGVPLVLVHRFDAGVLLDAVREHRPTFVLGTISALVSLAVASHDSQDFASVRRLASGGAAISPSTAERVQRAFGVPLTVVYGLTETTSPALAVPVGEQAPVDPESGALSIGVPVTGTRARIVGADGVAAGPGEFGELAVAGPQVVPGHWEADGAVVPGEDFVDGELRTGDIGFVDDAGWFYVIDRKKDMITTAGFKVWPREVEEVLHRHPDVAEVAVVGVPDEIRGESVTAFVALEPGRQGDVDALASYARGELAAYKCPRRIVLVDALPKTATGKILRRRLRDG